MLTKLNHMKQNDVRATNWAKLSATATLGVIHRGHEKESRSLMQSYLPKVKQKILNKILNDLLEHDCK